MCRDLGTSAVLTALLASSVSFKIFSVAIVSNLGLIKKVKLDENSRKKKTFSFKGLFFMGNAKLTNTCYYEPGLIYTNNSP